MTLDTVCRSIRFASRSVLRGVGLCCAITVLAVIPNVGDVITDALFFLSYRRVGVFKAVVGIVILTGTLCNRRYSKHTNIRKIQQ